MDFWKAAAIRAVRTMAQGAVALIGTNMVSIVDIDWPQILGCVATMGVLSILMSLAGLPEAGMESPVQYDDEVDADEEIEKLRDEIEDIKEQLELEAEKKKSVELENIELRKAVEDCTKRVEAIELRLTSQPVLHPVANPKFGDIPQTRANLEELANNKNFSPSTRYELSRAVAADEIADIMGVERA